MKKITKQLAAIAAVILLFGSLDLSVYEICTKRCLPDQSDGMKAKSIELDNYLPFDENSDIVDIKADTMLSGNLPVIDSAAALYPISSAVVNALYPEDSVIFDGSDFTAESKLQMRNTRTANKEVVDGGADIILCAYPSEEQLEYASENNVELEFVPIGREAFVFIVNNENHVNNISSEQLRDIYSGKIRNWSELGGENIPINAVDRNEGSGSQSTMLRFMNGEKIRKNPMSFLGSPIGFSFRYYVEGIVDHGGIKLLSIDGSYPDIENISSENYPIVSNFYAVYNKANDNPNISAVINWILSDEGQEMIKNTGYVPL